MTTHNDAPTVAAQQCGRVPDAYEVRCTDGNYEWRRPYHGELEVIMSTGRDRSGKPFEYRALYAAVSPLSTVTPAEVGGHADPQTEARAIARCVRGCATDDQYIELVERIATALAAKDAELAKFDFEKHSLKVSLARAEAQLAEARKALDEIGNGCDGRVNKDALPCRIARRAREQGGE